MALALAWLFPGAGHLYLGDVKRAVYIAAGVFFLFGFGLLIAGPTAVDSGLFYHNLVKRLVNGKTTPQDAAPEGDPIWFAGTLFVGPAALAVDYYHQYRLKVVDRSAPTPTRGFTLRSPKPFEGRKPANGEPFTLVRGGVPTYSRAIGRVAEIGVLSCTLAGMMNLIAIIDAAYNHRRRRTTPAGAGGGA